GRRRGHAPAVAPPPRRARRRGGRPAVTGNIVLRVAVKVLLPAILLFGLYVQAHGDLGPGGGFQAGVIFGAGFILYAIVFGLRMCQRVAPPRLVTALVAVGVLIYAGVGYLGLLLG